MNIASIDRLIKALPGIVLFISIMPVLKLQPIGAVVIVALFVLFYELFRKYPLRGGWLIMQIVLEVTIVIATLFLITTNNFYDALAVFLGFIILVLSVRVADLRALAVLTGIYILYLLYLGYKNPVPTNLYILANSLLIFMSMFIIMIRNAILIYRIDVPEDIIDLGITYLGIALLIPSAAVLVLMNKQYLYMALVPPMVSAIPMAKRYSSYVIAVLILVMLIYSVYPVIRLLWGAVIVVTLIFTIMYLRPSRLRFIKGLKPPISWLGTWLGGKYLIDTIIATGGFSYVVRGRDEWGRVYAIKILRDVDSRGNPLANDKRVLSSFKKEMSEYLLIDSPRIVKVFEVHIPPDEKLPYESLEDYLSEPPYVVMEYMEGGSLRDLLREKGPLDINDFLRIALSITLALNELHKSNIIHLDLKPENILFKDRGKNIVKIGDLGAAKIMVGGKSYVSQFSIAYAAPEVSKGIADIRSDIYSLSCIFYEMLTGINPHLYRLSHGQYAIPPINSYRPDIPPELASIIMKGLELNPTLRPSGTDEIIYVLNKLIH
ncbi:MAG: serine/threonine-protein kinase [Vulcanisaeta sp. AZ3]|nr:MAG: serine/threonine protein kinase [Vulcanisaeta sp. AZ3]